jgi:hypothetical protein
MGLFYIPVCVIIVLGVLLIASCVVKLFLVSSGLGKKKKIPKETYRILFFLFVLLYIYSFIIGFRWSVESQQDDVENSLQDYMTCFLKSQFYPSPTIDQCKWTTKLNKSLWQLACFNVSVQVCEPYTLDKRKYYLEG